MKKFYIASGIVLGIIILIIILIFTLFGVHKTSINFKTSSIYFNQGAMQAEILQSANLKRFSSIFFLNRAEVTNELEEKYPYLKIINIEAVFPNEIVLHCAEREPAFAISFGEKTLICDEELKVLDVETGFLNTQNNAIMLLGVSLENRNIKAGDFLNFENANVLQTVLPALKLNNRSLQDAQALIKSVEICLKPSVDDLTYKPALIFKDYTNFEAQIINADENLAYKISAYLEALSKLTPNDRENAYLYVYQENSKIIVHLIKK